ncbi:MAG: hypothetical protein JXL80_15535 [Planctomycetes bacterium]|nr:hypothetical protein [Planctomycetota bacterium]
MWILASELERFQEFLLDAGLYPTLAATSVAVFALSYMARTVENYIRHLHKKPYLHYGSPRFILATIGYILIADGFVIGTAFEARLDLHVATVTTSCGLLCLIVAAVLSLVPHVRQIREIREDAHMDGAADDDRNESRHE